MHCGLRSNRIAIRVDGTALLSVGAQDSNRPRFTQRGTTRTRQNGWSLVTYLLGAAGATLSRNAEW